MDRSMAKTFDKASFKTCVYTAALKRGDQLLVPLFLGEAALKELGGFRGI
jgi:hypothetical protein